MSGLPNCFARKSFLTCILHQISHGSESQPRQLLCASVSTVVPDLTFPEKCQSRPHAKMVLLEVCAILQRASSSICTVCTGARKLTKSALAIERRETKLYFLVFIARVRSHGGGREGGKKGVELEWKLGGEGLTANISIPRSNSKCRGRDISWNVKTCHTHCETCHSEQWVTRCIL